ncbi:MAG: efflux RND transporter permease subunit [Solirubrobacterales bacterium]
MERLSRALERVARFVARRPLPVLVAVVALSIGGGVLALRLDPSAGTDTLLSRGSETYKATADYHRRFGDDAVYVLVRENLAHLVLTSDIERLLGLEGCISGNLPRNVNPPGGAGGPCARLARTRPVRVVYGPGTFVNEAVRQIQAQFTARQQQKAQEADRAATAARKLAKARGLSPAQQRKAGSATRKLVYAQFVRDSLQLALQYGLRSVPRLNDPNFVAALVFDPQHGATTPKARFAYLFPNSRSALIQVRLKPELTDTQRRDAIGLVRNAVAMSRWRLQNHGTYTVTGAPVVVADLSDSLTDSIVLLLVAALVVMAATLLLVFRTPRARLLPLGIALAAAGLTFGGMALVGASLTMASIAVLPVLIGLAVDYAIQLHSRWDERRAEGNDDVVETAARVGAVGAPTILTAAMATAAGFLVLLLSPVPMVQGFGLVLVAGIVLAFACAITAGIAVLAVTTRYAGRGPRVLADTWSEMQAAGRGAGELVRAGLGRVGVRPGSRPMHERILDFATARPRAVLAAALALAAIGWIADAGTKVTSDVQKLMPQGLPALQDLRTIQHTTGVSGEIDLTVKARDLADPKVVAWMTSYQRALLRHYGYSAKRGCGKATLCPALSLPDLFRGSAGRSSQPLTRQQIEGVLNAVPPYFSQAVITPRHDTAALAFGIRLMPLDDQQKVVDTMRSMLHPPSGVTARLAGLPVEAAEANADVSSRWRRLLLGVGAFVLVGLVLFAVRRRFDQAVIPLVPIALATGWAGLLSFWSDDTPLGLLLGKPVALNPMSVTLGALVIALSTEFSVLLSARYRAERERGLRPRAALAHTYRSTGRAVMASAVTALAGFAVLVLSDIRMLRDFGLVTVVDLAVSLLGVLVVLPAVLMLAEEVDVGELPREAVRRARGLLPRRRRATAA